MQLDNLHRQMLDAGEFSIDGWTSQRGREHAAELEQAGYVTSFVSGSDEAQYTAVNYTITDAGRAALTSQ